MAAEIEFCLLGPLLVRCGTVVMPVPPGKQRTVLAALLLDAGRVVPVDELVAALWGSEPPVSARVTLQNYVMRLRKALAGVGQARISTHPGGYQISVETGELDLIGFTEALRAAQSAIRVGSWETAAAQACAALSLWRGKPLADVESELLADREIPRLAEMRLQAVEARIDAYLHLGQQGEVIAELQRLAGAHPLREHLHGLRMLALYRDGRQAEALAAYQHARRVLVRELGIEPGPELRELHQRILTADPALAAPEPGRPAVSDPPPVAPRQLPAPVAHFVGRSTEMALLTALLDQEAAGTPGPVVISAIGGTAGVGKTALAVQWAHQVAGRFPDGQLYVNLRGYDPAQPVTAAEALAGFLRALGVPGQDIPAEEDERAARYRSLLAGRRMLVLLDNASDVEQVRPVLPGCSACAVLVTSRDALAGLVARDGATRLELDMLPLPDAIRLIQTLVGERANADPDAVAEMATQCCTLPLALRIAAERAVARPGIPLAHLVGELADQQQRLDLLDADGDPRTAIRAVFSWSYRHLDAAAARMFQLASLHPGADFDSYAVAALAENSLKEARGLLDQMVRTHLVQSPAPGRYGMHDLLRAYARELAGAHDGGQEERAAMTRLFDHYLQSAAAAMDTLFPADRRHRPRLASSASAIPVLNDPSVARAWLDTERANLISVIVRCASANWPDHATRLAATISRYLEIGSHYPEAITAHTHAYRAARQAGDRLAEAEASNALGVVSWRQGRCQEATGHLQHALDLFRGPHDQIGEARVLGNLGVVNFQLGRLREATGFHQQALVKYREASDRTGEARTLGNLACVEERLGRYQQAADHLHQALALCREIHAHDSATYALTNLACVEERLGRYQQAADHLHEALALCRETGTRNCETHALTILGLVDLRSGRYQQAADHLHQAVALCREIGDRNGEAEALNCIGEVLLATDQPELSIAQHSAALDLASQTGDQAQQARACAGLGRGYQAAGDSGQAGRHWQRALGLYTSLGAPEAAQVRAELAGTRRLKVSPRSRD